MEDKVVQDMIERLVRIETKLDNYESLREKADSAKDRADAAYAIAVGNAEDIKEIKANNKWSWGYMIGLGITIIGYFITKLGGN
ncbi:hemolysin XhlA family protein [Enterococcus asini]|nr:hemolysin XhlA family protein [Enterococcus asini]MCD5030377.1 hemolysin XhlA family protein [Enterococcus asini]